MGQCVAQFFLQRDLFADQLAVFEQRLVGRVDDDDAVETVEQGIIARLHFLARVLQSDHGRDAQRPRHDGRVRGLAADVRGEAQHVFPVQLRGLGRRQIVRNDDARLDEMCAGRPTSA